MRITIIFFLAVIGIQTAIAQKVDRSKKPIPKTSPVLKFDRPATFKLPNGVTVLVVENHKLPRVSVSLTIDAGPVSEGDKAGVMSLMGNMLNEGTVSKSKRQFDEEVDKIGAEMKLYAFGGNVSVLTRFVKPAFMLMVEAIRHPAFPQASFQKLKSQALVGLRSNEGSTQAISGRVSKALLYGKNHPLGEFETAKSIRSITLDDVKLSYAGYMTPNRCYLTFVGDITPDLAMKLATETLTDWNGPALLLPMLDDATNPPATEVDVVDVRGAVQSEITVTNLISLPMNSPDFHAVLLANQILGGGSEARLFGVLREKYGFTYGAYANTGYGRFQSTFSASASVRNEKVDSAVKVLMQELERIRTTKVSTEELQDAKNLYNGTFALGMEDAEKMAGLGVTMMTNNLPESFYKTYLQQMSAVTVEDIQRVSQKYFSYNNTRIVVVGNMAATGDGLKKLGYPLYEFDVYANKVQRPVQK